MAVGPTRVIDTPQLVTHFFLDKAERSRFWRFLFRIYLWTQHAF